MKKIIWFLMDNRMGSVGQAKGIIQALDKERYEIVEKKIDYNRLANLPNFLLGKSLLGVTAATRKELRAPWPDLAVSISRRTVPAARFIKKASGGMTKLIQLMHPGKSGLKDFSLAAVPEHDRGKTPAPNIFYITGCPHRVTPEALAEAADKWSETFASLPRPLTAVIVGGAIKNIGMGCGSRAGKMEQHTSGKPAIDLEKCRGCRRCAHECGSDAITYLNGKAVIDYDKCKGCGRCIGACSFDAVYNENSCANELLDRKMAEYAMAVCQNRPCFHISLVQDISPNCDCHGENDAPILPDIGMFASFDPVALDQACADACLQATPIANSQLGEHLAKPDWHHHHDHFLDSNPNVEWEATLDQAEKIGLGTRAYELKRA